jgi:hypothetical protein
MDMLMSRDGLETEVELTDGRRLRVLNVAWGYDAGDHYAHVTTNISPRVPGSDIDFFFTNEIRFVEDTLSGEAVWRGAD